MGVLLRQQVGGISTVPYEIYTGPDGATGVDGALGHGESGNQVTCIAQVYQGDLPKFIREVCGIFAFDLTTGNLSRAVPARCPFLPWLYGARVVGMRGVYSSSQGSANLKSVGVNWPAVDHVAASVLFTQPKWGVVTDAALDSTFAQQSVAVVLTGDTANGSAVVTNLNSIGFCFPGAGVSGVGLGGGLTIASVDSATQLTLSGNAGVGSGAKTAITVTRNVRQEWERWTFAKPTPASEVLTVEGGVLRWAEGGAAPQPTANTPFNSPIGQFLAKPDILLTWYQVPFYGLFSPTTRLPETMMLATNCVNSQPFFGKPAGTLLLKGYDIQPCESPYDPLAPYGGAIAAGVLAGLANRGLSNLWPSLTCNVTLQFSYFDPPHDNSSFRGHNLAPWRGNGAANSGDFNWYLVDTKGDGTGKRIFPSFDHRAIFCAVG